MSLQDKIMNKITIEFSEQELNLVAQAIAEMPFRVAEPLMRSIQQQAQGQIQRPHHEEVPEQVN